MLDDGTIQPVVGGEFTFDETGEAHGMITDRRNVGKVVTHIVLDASASGRAASVLPCATDVVPGLALRFSCSPLGGNSAWRPRSRIPSREEDETDEKEKNEQ